jgi:MFS family permease
MAPGIGMASVGRALIGFGGAFAAIGSMSVVAVWHPSRYFALLIGCLVGFGFVGAIFGGSVLAILVNKLGWRHCMTVLGYIGILLGIIIWIFVKDRDVSDHVKEKDFFQQLVILVQGLKVVLMNPQLIYISLYGCFYFATTSAFGALWGIPYLMLKYQISNAQAGTLVVCIFAGWAVGSPLSGYLSERMRLRRPIVLWASLVATVFMTLVIYLNIPQWATAVCLFMFGLLSAGMVLIFSMGKENTSLENVATAMGFINCLNMIGGAVLQPGIGRLLDYFWQGGLSAEGVRIYTIANYHLALALLPISLVISLIFVIFIKETHCQTVVPK